MKELTTDACWQLMEEEQVAHVAQIDGDEPYVTPMSYVIHDGDFVFRTVAGRRVEALRRRPRVCVEISRSLPGAGWESVVFWGDARFVDDPDTEASIVAALLAKYHSESALGFSSPAIFPEERFLVAITPERLSGRTSGSGFSTETRPGRL
jgi:nitroimidazol reductase NimA-like FMN-containing flavoprotein (pyridoxamine 5'-phosphate oxidase superfamily)